MKRFIMTAVIVILQAVAHAALVPLVGSDELRRIQLMRDPGLSLVDVRPLNAYAQGHIQGARSISPKDSATAGLPQTARVVLYCDRPACISAQTAAANLASAGYQKVEILDGGFGEWLKRSYPVATGTPAAPKIRRQRVTSKDAHKRMAQAFTLDVRPASEYKAGHLPKAYNAPLEELEKHFIDLPKDKEILVYDRLSVRSQQAHDKLKAAGFNAEELSGGIAGWLKRKRPLEVN